MVPMTRSMYARCQGDLLDEVMPENAVAVAEQNKTRQIEVAIKNRERVIGIETERVEKDRALEQVTRERAVELQTLCDPRVRQAIEGRGIRLISFRNVIRRKP